MIGGTVASLPEGLLDVGAWFRVEAAANAGLVDGNTGKCEPTVDGLAIEVHAGIVELLGAAAQRALKSSH